jgi:hypothetical protein
MSEERKGFTLMQILSNASRKRLDDIQRTVLKSDNSGHTEYRTDKHLAAAAKAS